MTPWLSGVVTVVHTEVLFRDSQDWGLFTSVLSDPGYARSHLVSLYLLMAYQVSGSVWDTGNQNIYQADNIQDVQDR